MLVLPTGVEQGQRSRLPGTGLYPRPGKCLVEQRPGSNSRRISTRKSGSTRPRSPRRQTTTSSHRTPGSAVVCTLRLPGLRLSTVPFCIGFDITSLNGLPNEASAHVSGVCPATAICPPRRSRRPTHSIVRVWGSASAKPAGVPGQERREAGENSLLPVPPPFDKVAPCLVSSIINSPSPAQR